MSESEANRAPHITVAVTREIRDLYRVAGWLDRARCALLRRTFRVPLFRRAFADRALRMRLSFTFLSILALLLALIWPLWILAIGPVIYGIPHLISTARYVPQALSRDGRPKARARRLVIAGIVAVAAVRLLQNGMAQGRFSEWIVGGNTLELAMVVLLCLGLFAYTGPKLKLPALIPGAVVLSVLLGFSRASPLETVGVLILVHNAVGFFFWYDGCDCASDRRTSLYAFALFMAANAAIFTGVFDGLLATFSKSGALNFAGLRAAEVGASLFPWTHDSVVWTRGIVAYAFGQSVHYVIWLRMIPDQALYRPVPVTFRQSLGLLVEDFGGVGVLAIAGCMAAGIAVFLLTSFSEARTLYFYAASFHGYAEIAGLVVLLSDRLAGFSRSVLNPRHDAFAQRRR